MNDKNNKKGFIVKFQNFFINNFRKIIISIVILIIIVISFQSYSYYSTQQIKKTSINFFNSLEIDDDFDKILEKIKDNDNIFSTLSALKLIQKNNTNNNYNLSNELYKQIISKKYLDDLYKSSISLHAAYTLIDATYKNNSSEFFNDIEFFINNISDDLDSFFSIKKELEYLLVIAKGDLNKSDYKENFRALEIYNDIYNSNLVSSSVKERVKNIHEFQLYK